MRLLRVMRATKPGKIRESRRSSKRKRDDVIDLQAQTPVAARYDANGITHFQCGPQLRGDDSAGVSDAAYVDAANGTLSAQQINAHGNSGERRSFTVRERTKQQIGRAHV